MKSQSLKSKCLSVIGKLFQDCIGRFDTFLVLLELILSLMSTNAARGDRSNHQELFEQLRLLIRQLPVFWDGRHRSF